MPLCGVCPLTACSEQMVDNYRETEQNSDLVRSGNNHLTTTRLYRPCSILLFLCWVGDKLVK